MSQPKDPGGYNGALHVNELFMQGQIISLNPWSCDEIQCKAELKIIACDDKYYPDYHNHSAEIFKVTSKLVKKHATCFPSNIGGSWSTPNVAAHNVP